MGAPMVRRLLAAGMPVTVYNRTRAKAEALATEGAVVADSVADVLNTSDCVLLMLSDATAIHNALLTESTRSLLAGKTIIQMSTIAPSESKQLCYEIVHAGGDYLESPVLGSIPQATDGSLILMVGGTQEQCDRWNDLLKHFGSNIQFIGPVGAAAAMKLAMNQLIGSLTAAFSLSLGIVERHGLDVETFMQIVRGSALYAPTFDKKLSLMRERDFANPNFPTRHLHKDMRLVLHEAESLNLNTAGMEAICKILTETIENGAGDDDYSSLFSTVVP